MFVISIKMFVISIKMFAISKFSWNVQYKEQNVRDYTNSVNIHNYHILNMLNVIFVKHIGTKNVVQFFIILVIRDTSINTNFTSKMFQRISYFKRI